MNLSSFILKTLLYHHRFGLPLNLNQLCFFLISKKTYSKEFIQKELEKLTLKKNIIKKKNHYYLPGLKYSSLPDPKYYKKKLNLIKNLPPVLFKNPFLNFLAITGSVASKRPRKNDDIDLLLISQKNTLWTLRPFFLFSLWLKKIPFHHALKKPQKNHLCPNIILDSESLSIPKSRRSLISATDLVLMIPIFDRGGFYHSLLQKNPWAKKYLANAYHQKLKESQTIIKKPSTPPLFLFSFLNFPFFLIQYLYMLPKVKNESVSLKQVFFSPPQSLANYCQDC